MPSKSQQLPSQFIKDFLTEMLLFEANQNLDNDLIYDHGLFIFKLFDVWRNFSFPTSETKCDY